MGSFFLWHPLGNTQVVSSTYWNVVLRIGHGLLCSSLDSMSTVLKLLVESQYHFMDCLVDCLRKLLETSWSIF